MNTENEKNIELVMVNWAIPTIRYLYEKDMSKQVELGLLTLEELTTRAACCSRSWIYSYKNQGMIVFEPQSDTDIIHAFYLLNASSPVVQKFDFSTKEDEIISMFKERVEFILSIGFQQGGRDWGNLDQEELYNGCYSSLKTLLAKGCTAAKAKKINSDLKHQVH